MAERVVTVVGSGYDIYNTYAALRLAAAFCAAAQALGTMSLILAVSHRGQPCQDIAQVAVGLDTVATAALNYRVEHCTAFSGVGISEKQPILFSEGGRPDRVFDQVVVDFNERILEINLQRLPLIQSIVDGLAHRTLGQEASRNVPPLEDPTDSCAEGPALAAAISIPQRPTGSLSA